MAGSRAVGRGGEAGRASDRSCHSSGRQRWQRRRTPWRRGWARRGGADGVGRRGVRAGRDGRRTVPVGRARGPVD